MECTHYGITRWLPKPGVYEMGVVYLVWDSENKVDF
jgi:hypothetical protein